ncbi:junctional adhesion molecule-like [Paramormyrops kingsleyae]|uniref:junctional adhesion molecule-like n=1 Tax=Paramormyrops kingsleyae TaxID=1676925 RepID=UPI003B978091
MGILTSFISIFSNCKMMFRLLLLLCFGHCLPGADSQGITAHIGDTVMMPCVGPADTDTKEVDVLWLLGGKPACWFKNGSWCETGHYVNRTQLRSIQQNNFSLVINPVKEEDDGVYICRINHKDRQIIRLNIKGDGKREDAETPPGDPVCRPYREREDHPGASSGGNSVVIGLIVGIVVTVGATV